MKKSSNRALTPPPIPRSENTRILILSEEWAERIVHANRAADLLAFYAYPEDPLVHYISDTLVVLVGAPGLEGLRGLPDDSLLLSYVERFRDRLRKTPLFPERDPLGNPIF